MDDIKLRPYMCKHFKWTSGTIIELKCRNWLVILKAEKWEAVKGYAKSSKERKRKMKIEKALEMLRSKIHDPVPRAASGAQIENEVLFMAIDALEKQTPKKPVNIERFRGKISNAECPHCKSSFPDIGGINEAYGECEQYEYCPDCGQKLDWSE